MAEEKMKTKGRYSICPEGKTINKSIKFCPSVIDSLMAFCKESGLLPSQVVNQAVASFIERNKKDV